MLEPTAVEIFRAAVEAIVPAVDGRPGALEIHADEHVSAMIDQYVPGFADLIAVLLDSYASDVRTGAGFVELSPAERGSVFRLMVAEEAQDVRDMVDALFVFTYGAVYSEWSAYDKATRTLGRPPSWDDIGFPGPSLGYADYREGA